MKYEFFNNFYGSVILVKFYKFIIRIKNFIKEIKFYNNSKITKIDHFLKWLENLKLMIENQS